MCGRVCGGKSTHIYIKLGRRTRDGVALGARLVVGDGDALLDGEADAVAVKDEDEATLGDAADETVADADLVPV